MDGAFGISAIWLGGCLAGLSGGLVVARKGWTLEERHVLLGRRFLKVFLLFASAAAIWLCSAHWGMSQFGGFDMSIPVDVGWRLINGQQPYKDFGVTVPPGFYLGTLYAHELFGVSWQSIVWFSASYAVATFLWGYCLLRRIFSNYLYALLLAVFASAVSTMLVGFWWYNPITTAAAVVFFLSAVLFLRKPDSRVAWISYVFSLVLLAAMKPHVAGILILGVSLVLASSREHRWKVAGFSALAFLLFVSWMAAHHIHISDMLNSYFSVASHGFGHTIFFQEFHFYPLGTRQDEWTRTYRLVEKSFAILMFALIVAPMIFSHGPGASPRQRLLAIAAVLAGFEGFFINGEAKLVDLPLVLLGCAVYFLPQKGSEPSAPAPKWAPERYISVLACLLIFAGLAECVTRFRVLGVGYGLFFEYETNSEPYESAYFKDFRSGKIFHTLVKEIHEAVTRHPGARIYFGPRMQWGYAAFGLPAPTGQPIWWHPGVAVPFKDQETYIQRFTADKFDLLIFMGNDRTYFPDEFLAAINDNYIPEEGYSTLGVLRLKPK